MRRVTSDVGATSVTHDGETYSPLDGTDAVFDVPDELGEHLLGLAGWRDTTDDDLPDDDTDETAPAQRRRRAPRRSS